MSGEYRDEQNTRIEATDDEELAKRHGLTQFDKATGQWRRPQAPDAGQRDGTDRLFAENSALREEIEQLSKLHDERDVEVQQLKNQIKDQGDGEKSTSRKPRNAGPQDGK